MVVQSFPSSNINTISSGINTGKWRSDLCFYNIRFFFLFLQHYLSSKKRLSRAEGKTPIMSLCPDKVTNPKKRIIDWWPGQT
jgi:hypothetical protein